ncbi:MAG: phosphoribosylformylglycinamidine cyclo-ligase [Chloroflexi bacterium]|nr:phosphoribosylformylglycinamidine cyclo-ligase [Chloroflexota bacterium]
MPDKEGPKGLTYRDAGVDLAAAANVKEVIKHLAATTHTAGVRGPAGFFAGAIEFPPGGDTLLVASTDSVGTKVKIAAALGRFRGLGIDVVNQNVNDILAAGGEPLFFLDYIGLGKLDPRAVAEIVEGVAQACREAGCALIGGETAELPGMYAPSEFDLVGFVVGAVRKDRILTGAGTRAGDALLGLPSSGPHTNGFSLIRMVFGTDSGVDEIQDRPGELDGRSIADALLAPHRSYLADLRPVLGKIRGLAHITGGGVYKNLPRSIPDGLAARIVRSTWDVPELFHLIQKKGRIADDEMFRVFNMGVGMIVIVEASKAEEVQKSIPGAWRIGDIVPRSGEARVVFS